MVSTVTAMGHCVSLVSCVPGLTASEGASLMPRHRRGSQGCVTSARERHERLVCSPVGAAIRSGAGACVWRAPSRIERETLAHHGVWRRSLTTRVLPSPQRRTAVRLCGAWSC